MRKYGIASCDKSGIFIQNSLFKHAGIRVFFTTDSAVIKNVVCKPNKKLFEMQNRIRIIITK